MGTQSRTRSSVKNARTSTAAPKKTTSKKTKAKAETAKSGAAKSGAAKGAFKKDTAAKGADPLKLAADLWGMVEELSKNQNTFSSADVFKRFNQDLSLFNPATMSENLHLALQKSFENSGQLNKATQDYVADLGVLMQKSLFMNPQGAYNASPVISEGKKDKRFRNQSWDEVPYFSFLKQNYLLWKRFMETAFGSIEGLSNEEQKRVNFYVRQLCDALSPTNVPWMNPDALQRTFETGGQNIIQGLENLYRDFEKGQGYLDISMVDQEAFKLGENIATTPGKVVHQNDLVQLIQYEASTEKVFEIPILIIPPCINKYYVFDLRPENSFVKWLRDQGFTVFIISWVNPSKALAKKGFEDYVLEGVLESAQVAADICKVDQVNAMGFCIGGNFLAVANAYCAAKKQKNLFKSATYLATLFDFSKAGDLSLFLGEDQLKSLEQEIRSNGFMDGEILKRTFNILRANDLIWSFVISNYFLGDKPSAFDFLYWNSDSTNLPAKMYTTYLRRLFFENRLMKSNALKVKGVGVDLGAVKTPTFILNTIEDHIAPWKSGYEGMGLFGSDEKKFMLAGSGHVVGIFNPPVKNKYSYFENNASEKSPENWFDAAQEFTGSWWGKWQEWVETHSVRKVPARSVGSLKHYPIEDAPGSYVKKFEGSK